MRVARVGGGVGAGTGVVSVSEGAAAATMAESGVVAVVVGSSLIFNVRFWRVGLERVYFVVMRVCWVVGVRIVDTGEMGNEGMGSCLRL